MSLMQWLRGAPPTRTQFVEQFISLLKRHGCHEAVHRLPNVYGLQLGSHARVFLDGIYTQYCNTIRKRRRHVLERFVHAMLETTTLQIPQYEHARKNLLPLLRSPLAIALTKQTSLTNQTIQPLPAARELADFLILQLGFDQTHTISRLTEQELKRWQVSFDTALQDAVANLRARTDDRWQQLAPGLFLGDWRDDYESSRILLTDVICRLKVRGEPVAMIPTRNTLLVTGSQDLTGLRNLAKVTEEILQRGNHWVIAQPLILTQEGWQLFNVPAQLKSNFRRLIVIDAASAYNHQSENLRQSVPDAEVADYQLLQQGTDLVSVATWRQSEKIQLLPYTDLLCLQREQDGKVETIHLNWSVALKYLGAYIQTTDYVPPRYQIQGFPSALEWDMLLPHRLLFMAKRTSRLAPSP